LPRFISSGWLRSGLDRRLRENRWPTDQLRRRSLRSGSGRFRFATQTRRYWLCSDETSYVRTGRLAKCFRLSWQSQREELHQAGPPRHSN
jgi:hypothetical protein